MVQTMPPDTILTLQVEDQDIPVLFSQLIVNGEIMSHPAVVPRQQPPQLEHDDQLKMVVQGTPNMLPASDPNIAVDANHILAPLMERAAQREYSMINGPTEVII